MDKIQRLNHHFADADFFWQPALKPFFTLRALDVQLYRLCDDLSGGLILPMLIFNPWAFGTTQPWSIACMNAAGFALGVLLLAKLFIRKIKKYPAPRWDRFSSHSGTISRRRHPFTRLLNRTMAALTIAVLAFILVSALNTAANYDSDAGMFRYRHYLSWLPHSFDGARTWRYFWMYLALAAAFWSLADWLAGMTLREERTVYAGESNGGEKFAPLLPARLRMLLWVLSINGAALGIEAIVQRATGSNKLLFLVVPQVHKEGEAQFGPYAYRSNAAQYFNLLWPVCLGFWLALQRIARGKAHHWLLPCGAIMAACPIISTSRAGALISLGILILALLYLAITSFFTFSGLSSFRWSTSGLVLLFATAALGLGWYFGWDLLAPRMEQLGEGYQQREEMYAAAAPMAKDYPLFGTGPGTFGTVFQLYRFSSGVYWPEQLHNDWLETRITFGWLGFLLLLSTLACIVVRWFVPGGIRGSRRFVVLSWLALAGALVFARYDFPFQIHSTLFLFLVICAILFGLSRNASGGRHS
jgi:O-antigen ligase